MTELKEPTVEELKMEIETQSDEEDLELTEETGSTEDLLEGVSNYLRFNSNQIPQIAVGAGAGTTPGTPTLTNANDTKGQISITTGTSTPAGIIITLTFARNYQTAPIVILTPANAATAAIMVTSKIAVTSTTTTFTINSTTTALGDSTAYSWYYHCLE